MVGHSIAELLQQKLTTSFTETGMCSVKIRNTEYLDHEEDANRHLWAYLFKDASEIQVQETFKFVSTKTDYGKISQFAAKLLQQLHPGQFVAWLVIVSPTLG